MDLKKIRSKTIIEVTSSEIELDKFLKFSSKMYNYKAENMIVIYGQNPDAEIVDTLEGWRKNKVEIVVEELEKKDAIFVYGNGRIINVYNVSEKNAGARIKKNKKYKANDEIVINAISHKISDVFSEKISIIVDDIKDSTRSKLQFKNDVINSSKAIVDYHFQIKSDNPKKEIGISSFSNEEKSLFIASIIYLSKNAIKYIYAEFEGELELVKTESKTENKVVETKSIKKVETNLLSSDDPIALAKEKLSKELNNKNMPLNMIIGHIMDVVTIELAGKILEPNKNMKNCFAYIQMNVEKLAKNGCAIVEETKVYSLALKYFKEDQKEETRKELSKKIADVKVAITTPEIVEKNTAEQLNFLSEDN